MSMYGTPTSADDRRLVKSTVGWLVSRRGLAGVSDASVYHAEACAEIQLPKADSIRPQQTETHVPGTDSAGHEAVSSIDDD